MKEQFDTKLAQSVVEWLNYTVCNDGGGFSVFNESLYLQEDSTRKAFKVYQSPYRSWVYDSSVNGAIVPSGFYNQSGQFLTRESGLLLDFQNGRVLSSGNWGGLLTGSFCKREFNVQFTSTEVAGLYVDRVYEANKDIDYTKTGASPYSYTAPIIFVTNATASNENFELGGAHVNSKRSYRLYCITNDAYSQEALVTVMTDKVGKMIPIINSSQTPLNFYGDIKNSGFNYESLKTPESCGSGAYIENVFHYKLDYKGNKTSTWMASIYDLKLEIIRIV
jgi:hypothetical protein